MNYKKIILTAIKQTSNTAQKRSQIISILELVEDLSKQLQKKNYTPNQFSYFIVQDPKIREIFAPIYTDRIIHHILIDNINPFIDKKFIFDNYANRKTKGIHCAILRLQQMLRKQKVNYFLQCDIKNFFPSINKIILKKLVLDNISNIKEFTNKEKNFYKFLAKKIINQDTITSKLIYKGNTKLYKKIHPSKSLFNQPKHKGLPIGSLSSQFFSNLYMNEFDQFVKHKLKIKYYIRYMDDFIILAENTQILKKWLNEIKKFLKTKLDLELQTKKTILQHTNKGINFLGYITRKNYILVRKRSVKSFKKTLYFFNHLIDPIKFSVSNPPKNKTLTKLYKRKELIPPIKITPDILQNMLATINSYYGIFRLANSSTLRKNIYTKHFHHLKKFYVPKNEQYLSCKIRNRIKKQTELL